LKKCFGVHAPRQTGKTSSMLSLVDYLNTGSRYRALYCNVETAQTAREDVAKGMKSILMALGTRAANDLEDDFLLKNREPILSVSGEHDALMVALSRFSQSSVLPVVLVIDEIDVLVGESLISVLHQIQPGFYPGCLPPPPRSDESNHSEIPEGSGPVPGGSCEPHPLPYLTWRRAWFR
jgi:hypothetical protein